MQQYESLWANGSLALSRKVKREGQFTCFSFEAVLRMDCRQTNGRRVLSSMPAASSAAEMSFKAATRASRPFHNICKVMK